MQGQIDEALYQRCQEVQADFVSLWRQLVNIDSGTGYGEGLTEVGNIAVAFLKTVGADIQQIPVEQGKAGFHIIATITGSGSGKILAMAHMDTVFATGTAVDRPFRIADEWAYGPGVSDCKGSVALCLFALKLLHERNYQNFAKITCLFNCDEETGSPSSRDLIQTLAQEHDVVLCCEPGQVGDGVVLWRKGSARMTVEVQGRSSHAGSAPQDGRNAIMELINQVAQLSQLEDTSKLTSLNFTTIQAGDRTNVIPDYAVAQADIRVVYTSELERIEQQSALIARQRVINDTNVTVRVSRQNPPFPQNEGTTALIAHAQNIYGELGLSLKEVGAGGASDANWAATVGAVVIDGLGPVKGGINHTDKERTNIHSVAPRLYLLTRLFMDSGKE